MKTKIIKDYILNTIGILTSRIFGLIRDLLIAATLGAGLHSDIFVLAIKMPSVFRRVFAEGAFNQSFMPNLSKVSKKGEFCYKILITFSITICILCILVSIFSSFFTSIFALGFSKELINMSKPFVVINFWYLFLIFFVVFLTALLNYKQKFFIASMVSAIFNLCVIIACLLCDKNDKINALYFLSYGVIISGFLQIFILLIAAKNNPILKAMFLYIKQSPKKHTQNITKGFYKNFFYASIGGGATQISVILDTTIASFLASASISYMYYANRVFLLPVSLLATALASVIFPKILLKIKNKNDKEVLNIFKKSFEFLGFLLILATIGGMILSEEIIKILFQRGNFNHNDTIQTALVLKAYLVGLFAVGVSKLFSLWLFANFKQKLSSIISIKVFVLNTFCAIVLAYFLGAYGIAYASSIGGFYLLLCYIQEFGLKRFLSIIDLKIWALFTIFCGVYVYILYFVKDFLNAYF